MAGMVGAVGVGLALERELLGEVEGRRFLLFVFDNVNFTTVGKQMF